MAAGCRQFNLTSAYGIGDYGEWGTYKCAGLTPAQIQIILRLKNRFPTLRVSAPAGLFAEHHVGDNGLDFTDRNQNNKVLFQVFDNLIREGWAGGVGIGIKDADIHVHVDLEGRRRYWIETNKSINSPDWYFYGSQRWPEGYRIAKEQYGWSTDPVPVASAIKESSSWEDLKKAAWIAGGIATAVFFRDEIREIVRKAIK